MFFDVDSEFRYWFEKKNELVDNPKTVAMSGIAAVTEATSAGDDSSLRIQFGRKVCELNGKQSE